MIDVFWIAVGAKSAVADNSPAALLRLAGDPVPWRLLSALARSHRRVGQLTELIGHRQALGPRAAIMMALAAGFTFVVVETS